MSEDSNFWGSGWSFPPTFDLDNNRLQLVHKEQNINQSIDIILKTLRGERSMNAWFGSNIGSFIFKNIDANTKGQILESVKNTLLQHEPRIDVDDVILTVSDDQTMVNLFIDYTVRNTNSRYNHVYPFALFEGSNLPLRING